MEEEKKESIYKNPIMETYDCGNDQLHIFDFIPDERPKKKDVPFELCMNPPIED